MRLDSSQLLTVGNSIQNLIVTIPDLDKIHQLLPKNSRPDKLELPVVHSIPKATENELEESGEQTYVADRVDIIAKEIEGTEVKSD